jgi:two-component system, LytTR family, sensor kinase
MARAAICSQPHVAVVNGTTGHGMRARCTHILHSMPVIAALDEQDRDSPRFRHFPHGQQLAGIAAFWLIFGALSITNWLFPPFGDGPNFSLTVGFVGSFASLVWMLATPPLFWLTSKYSVERGDRLRTVVLYLLAALIVAFAVDAVGEWVRGNFGPQPRFRGGRGAGRPRPYWALTRGRFLNDYMVTLAIISAGVARDYFMRYHHRLEESTRLKAQLVEARLSMLQSQLNPHFLFNTLNAVSSLVDRDPRGVRRMIARLSELLRATLEPASDPEVPVSREVAMLERYLEILRIRFQGRLETSIVAGADVQEALLPPMILQPLVENSMKHAVSKTSAPSRIDVHVERNGESLVLSVRDTGAQTGDANPEEGDVLRQAGLGIGLRNTRARLEEIYGHDYALELDKTNEGGLNVTIRLPYHTARDLQAVESAR